MSKRILVVDDEERLRDGIVSILLELGYDAKGAGDGVIAFDMIAEEKPDVMLLDINMPVMDGNEVCLKMKADDDLKDIPVILMTGTDTLLLEQKVGEKLAEDFIVKPFEFKDLLVKLDRFLV